MAHALDLVGERWTLLIVRELLVAARRYGELSNNLVGIGTNLLSTRLRELTEAGLVRLREQHYELTEHGRQLEPVVSSLVRFGLTLDVEPDRRRVARPEWDAVALGAIFNPARAHELRGSYSLALDGHEFTLNVVNGRLAVSQGRPALFHARIQMSKATGLRLAKNALSARDAMRRGLVKIAGSRSEARQLLESLSGNGPREYRR